MSQRAVHTNGPCFDGTTALLGRTGWAFVALGGDDVVRASAHGVPPPWISSIFAAEAWAVLQAVSHAMGEAVLRIDCKAAWTSSSQAGSVRCAQGG